MAKTRPSCVHCKKYTECMRNEHHGTFDWFKNKIVYGKAKDCHEELLGVLAKYCYKYHPQ